ncbi:hypothetical protein BH23CHL5_BH23CHL5_14300 [soil metagenome]
MTAALAGQSITVESDDINVIQLDFGDNRFAQILSSFAVAASRAPAMEIHGSKGSFSIGAGSWYEASGAVDILLLDDSPLGVNGWMKTVSNPAPTGPQGEHLIGAGARHFIECIAGTVEPVLTAEHAIHVLDIILSARAAARSGNAVPLSTKF